MAVASWEDVAVALGRPSSDVTELQQAQWGYWLNGAEIVVRSRLGDPYLLDLDSLKYVETEVVAGKVRNTRPDNSTSITVTADDGAVTRRFEAPPVSASDFTDEWWGLLSPAGAGSAYSAVVTSPIDMPRTTL